MYISGYPLDITPFLHPHRLHLLPFPLTILISKLFCHLGLFFFYNTGMRLGCQR